MNSSTNRLLPMPGSPRMVTKWLRSLSRTRSNASTNRASSRRLSTSGMVRRVDRTERACAGQALSSSENPRAATDLAGPYPTAY